MNNVTKILSLVIVMILCAGISPAQDIITLQDGTRIENVVVQSITDREITYSQNDSIVSIPHNSAEAILYADGRFETISKTLVGDSAAIAAAETLGFDAQELQTIAANGEDRKMFLWQDKTYPAECRKKGKNVYYKVFKELYEPALKEAKKSGMKQIEAVQQAYSIAFPKALKAGNETVRECNGGM